MNRNVHPSSELLAAYASGSLVLAAALPISAHLEGCASCRRRLSAFEAAEGRLLDAMTPATMKAGALADVLSRLGEPETPPARSPRISLGDVVVPSAAAAIGFRARRWVAPGYWVAHAKAPSRDGWRAFLLRAPAGAAIPEHEHGGGELIFVISGAFEDQDTYGPGALVCHKEGTRHTQRVGMEGPCACLIAIQGPLDWQTHKGRLAGWALGI